MNYDNILDLVKNRRSFRRFKPDPIPAGAVEKVLEIGRYVPSAANAQPWEFVVVRDEEMKKSISKNIAQKFGELVKKDTTLRVGIEVHPYLYQAPVLIVVCGDPRLQQAYPDFLDGKILLHQSLAICIYAMQIAAASLGLATAWATIQIEPPETEVKRLLGIPDFYIIDHIIPLGYPDEEAEKRNEKLRIVRERVSHRRKLEEMVHYGYYDKSRLRSDEEVKQFIWSGASRIPDS